MCGPSDEKLIHTQGMSQLGSRTRAWRKQENIILWDFNLRLASANTLMLDFWLKDGKIMNSTGLRHCL